MRRKESKGRLLALLIGSALMGSVLMGTAQGARITDKLLAGLYASPKVTDQPTRVLPSDTPLERLEKSGDFTKVRLGDGSEGWVESRFITDEKPARVMLLELQAKSSQLQQKLRDAERQLKAMGKEATEPGSQTDDPELIELKRQLADVKAENELLKREREAVNGQPDNNEKLAQRIAELEQQLANATPSAAKPAEEDELKSAREANRQLQQRLEQIARIAGSPEATITTPDENAAGTFQAWELPLLLLAMLFSFIGGVAFKNYRLAKRYGGFRI
ncbi:TIGR04211 family SH3 domain-containing protein [Sedimenticola sp.]|uniref:TIGR04211 family SH3 domain-containing protein n=1 Tax=Sedimenticola sp. TaxID=1940285 RepID=UPI003D0AF552